MNSGRDTDRPSPSSGDDKGSPAASRTLTITSDRINSRALFGAARQITIEHGAESYTLRLTAQNKLILTK